jgi:hypothetical protein
MRLTKTGEYIANLYSAHPYVLEFYEVYEDHGASYSVLGCNVRCWDLFNMNTLLGYLYRWEISQLGVPKGK